MSKQKWTKGPCGIETPMGEDQPWVVDYSAGQEAYEWRHLATVHADGEEDGPGRLEGHSNARLYAAAPDLAEAAEKAVKSHQYKTPAGTMNCRYCDANMDHEGTYRDMHAEGCVIPELRAALAKAGAK